MGRKAKDPALPADYQPGPVGRPGSATKDFDGEKLCRRCGERKPLSEFHRRGNSYQSRCKPCQIKAVQETADPARVLLYAQKYHADHRVAKRQYERWYYAAHIDVSRVKSKLANRRFRARHVSVRQVAGGGDDSRLA